MNLIERYLGRAVLQSTALVLLVLLALNSIIVFVEELGDVGQGDYTAAQAALYVLLTLPDFFYQFFAVAVLLGCLFGIGNLAVSSELTILRATGWSVSRIITAVCKTSILMMLCAFLLGEWLAPHSKQWAEEYRSWLISGGQMVRAESGIWAKDRDVFVHIGSVREHTLRDVTLYQLNDQGALQSLTYAAQATMEQTQWSLYQVQRTLFQIGHVQSQSFERLDWSTELSPSKLGLLALDAEAMDLSALYEYRHYLAQNGQKTHQYDFIFWQKIFQPFATLVMTLLAMAFIFGPLRSGTFGSRLVIGLILGFSFSIANKIIGEVSVVWELPASVVAAVPSVLFLLLAQYLIRRKA